MSTIKISGKEILIGKTIPWSIYDGKGTLLLQKGSMVTSNHQLNVLLERGMYRDELEVAEPTSVEREPVTGESNPFEIFDDLAHRITEIFSRIVQQTGITYKELQEFCTDFQDLCEKDADAALGAVHLCHNHPYTICHPLHGAILSELIAKSVGYDIEKRIPIVAAALTANLGMLDLQEILHHQPTPITDDQRERIQMHPEESVRMLKEAGIDNPDLLQIIKQHHERIDRSGYPDKLDRSAIIEGAQIIAIADRYAAMVSSRSYRQSLRSKDALKEFFLQKNKLFDEKLTLTFIKELGVFPPGTYVTLRNGETAVVVERGKESMWPIVISLTGSGGALTEDPVRRDCNSELYAINEVVSVSEPLLFNLHTLWGYT
ncbi:MAG: HD domain-containing protein [Gammaproteobacteria bacterium]|nr:HD domain-containing protein [Gammaproteobacteria bacterium]MCK5091055.1 HD domain-containing protein [Gammaproteobacteria bacterium]